MFADMRFPTVSCVGLGLVLAFLLTSSSAWSKDLFSTLRSYKIQSVKTDEEVSGGSAQSLRTLAKTHADQNDGNKASTYFGHALKNATPQQTPAIAAEYAAFLVKSGDLRKAELVLKQALTQSPDNAELTRMLARCLVRQEKMVEGLRYLQSISSEAEAKAEIAAIYREQGNADMVAAVERKWGTAATVRPEVRPEPVHMAAQPTQTSSPMLSPPVLPAKATVPSVPTLVVHTTTSVGTAPALQTISRSALPSAKIPIPIPNSSSQPAATTVAKAAPPALPAPTPKLVAPMPPAGVRPAAAPTPELVQSDAKPARPETGKKPSKHYMVDAGTTADLDTLFPIKPVNALLPMKSRTAQL